jgi:hypothetical protein
MGVFPSQQRVTTASLACFLTHVMLGQCSCCGVTANIGLCSHSRPHADKLLHEHAYGCTAPLCKVLGHLASGPLSPPMCG